MYIPICLGSTLSGQRERQVTIAPGRPDLYNGHPTTVMMDDHKTILCTWSYGHGGKASFIAESKDAGLTWKNGKTPADWQTMSNCPSIYKLTDKQGKELSLCLVPGRTCL